MPIDRKRYRQRANRAEVPFRSLVTLVVQLLVLELCCTLFAGLLVLLAMCPLAVHAAVLDEEAGRAVPELDPVLAVRFATVGAYAIRRQDGTAHVPRLPNCQPGSRPLSSPPCRLQATS